MSRRVLAGLFAAVVLAGCSGESRPTEPTEPSARARPDPAPAAAARAGWQVIESWTRAEPARFGIYTADYLATWDEHQAGNPSQLTQVRDHHGRVLVEHRSRPPAWFTQDVWITGDVLVVEDIDDGAREVRLAAYRLPSGERIALPGQPTQPEVGVAEGRLVYTTGTSTEGMCEISVELPSGRAGERRCAAPGAVLGDVAAADGGYAYSRLAGADSAKRCKNLTVVDAAGEATAVDLRQPCRGWSVAVGKHGYAWDEMDPSRPDLGTARGYVSSGGEVVPLGDITTDSILGCGDGFYWEAQDGRGARIEEWHPDTGVRTIRPATMRAVPTGLSCTEGRWLQTRFDQIHGGDERLTFEIYDTEAGR